MSAAAYAMRGSVSRSLSRQHPTLGGGGGGGLSPEPRGSTGAPSTPPTARCFASSVATTDDDDGEDVVYVRINDRDAADEARLIEELVEGGEFIRQCGGFWSRTGGPRAEGPQQVFRSTTAAAASTGDLDPLPHQQQHQPSWSAEGGREGGGDSGDIGDCDMVGDEFSDLEDDSDAYADSLEDDELEWIEEQLRAKENPADFFF